jgi:esterase
MLYSKIEGQGTRAEGEQSAAKPLLILHGFLGMSDNWKSLGSQYATAGFQTHLLDLRNHGKSFHSDDFSYEVMSKDVLDYCNEHQLNKVSIIGHSMGGKVAMLFATNYPERVEKLVVADIGPKYYKPHHQEILAGLNAVDFLAKPSRTEVEEILFPYIPDFGTRQFLMKNLFWIEPGQLAFRFNLKAFNSKIEEIGTPLPKNAIFSNPTLFIRGGNSNYILDADVEEIKMHFPNMQLDTIPNVGHWLHAENPKLFFDKTIVFLK